MENLKFSKRLTSNKGSMAIYALGSWNASLTLDPRKTVKKEEFSFNFLPKMIAGTNLLAYWYTKDNRLISPWKTEYVLIHIALLQSGNSS